MNKVAFIVQIFQAKKNLLCNDSNKWSRNSLLLMPFDESQQILSEWLEHDTDVRRLWPLMCEGV